MDIKKAMFDMKKEHASASDKIGLVFANKEVANTTVDEVNRHIRCTATSSSVDVTDELVLSSGVDWSYFEKNNKVLINHDRSIQSTVGKVVNKKAVTKLVNGKLVNTSWNVLVYIFPLKSNSVGEDILLMAKESGIGMSIGFKILEKGPPTRDEINMYNNGKPFKAIIRRCQIIEISFVATPCNIECADGFVDTSVQTEKIIKEKKNIVFL